MPQLQDQDALKLAETLFVPVERWGWRYLEPVPVRPSPDLSREPRWIEPQLSDLWGVKSNAHTPLWKIKGFAWSLGLVVLLVLSRLFESYSSYFVLGMLAVGVAWFVAVLRRPSAVDRLRQDFDRHRQEKWDQYAPAHQSWREAVAHWDRNEYRRWEATSLWYPVSPQTLSHRVDVFGGTPPGWSAMLATVGTSILATGTSLCVVDFTEEDVGGPLLALATLNKMPALEQNLPSDLAAARLLDGLSPETVAELIAEAVNSMRTGGENVELRTLDVELIRTVVIRLEGDITWGRVAAGLLALQQGYDPDRDERLSAAEFQRITEVVDTVAGTERVRNEIQLVRGMLELLPTDDPPGEGLPAPEAGVPRGMWPGAGLIMLRIEDDHRLRRDFVDRLIAQVLLQNVRRRVDQDQKRALVLAGADHLGQTTLELLARRCRQSNIRLVLLLEHLRGDLQHFLGGSDSVTIFMRLGNAKEAALAAEQIGRGHSFLLTQLTRQTGLTDTVGDSYSVGTSTSYSLGLSATRSRSPSASSETPKMSWQFTPNSSVGISDSEQWSINTSRAVSSTDGETVSRVYEFSVEPTRIQSLDPLSFLLVEAVNGERRVVAGTCDPGVALMPRVSGQ